MSEECKSKRSKKDVFIAALIIFLAIALSVAAIYYKDDLMRVTLVAGYGLVGMLIIAFLAGSTLSLVPVPVPYWLLLFTLPSVFAERWGILAPIGIGLISALGCSLGHLPTFLIGYGGARLSRGVALINISCLNRAMEWAKRRGSWAVFAMSAIPNPAHLPSTMAIGALHYSPLKFFLFSLLGNMVKSLSIAFSGYFGLSSLLRFLGI